MDRRLQLVAKVRLHQVKVDDILAECEFERSCFPSNTHCPTIAPVVPALPFVLGCLAALPSKMKPHRKRCLSTKCVAEPESFDELKVPRHTWLRRNKLDTSTCRRKRAGKHSLIVTGLASPERGLRAFMCPGQGARITWKRVDA